MLRFKVISYELGLLAPACIFHIPNNQSLRHPTSYWSSFHPIFPHQDADSNPSINPTSKPTTPSQLMCKGIGTTLAWWKQRYELVAFYYWECNVNRNEKWKLWCYYSAIWRDLGVHPISYFDNGIHHFVHGPPESLISIPFSISIFGALGTIHSPQIHPANWPRDVRFRHDRDGVLRYRWDGMLDRRHNII